jgi:hypothetical protein
MYYPSIMAHMLNGLLLFTAVVYVLFNLPKIQTLDTYNVLLVILLFSIAMGVHGLSHLFLEKEYNYVPFNLWKLPKDKKLSN